MPMTVPVGRRSKSRLEVLYNATKLNDAISELAYRSFGIYSRNSMLRRHFLGAMQAEENRDYIERSIEELKRQLLASSSNVERYVICAKNIYPRNMRELDRRLDYQSRALEECYLIKSQLQEIARIFNVDLTVFRDPHDLVVKEINLIKRWRKSDENRFTKKLSTSQ